MKFSTPTVPLAVVVGLLCIGSQPAQAVNREQIRVRWDCAPEVT